MPAKSKLELLLELKNNLAAGFSKAKGYVNTEMADLKGRVSQFTAANTQAFAAIKEQVPGVASSLGMLKNPYVLAAAAAVAFGAAAVKSANMAMDWEKGMAKINVTAGLGKDELGRLSSQIRYLGSQGSTDLMEVPQAFNRIISAGLTVEQSMAALQPTLKATKAGFSDIETVAGAGIAMMKSSGQDINTVYDTLFATMNKGNAEFSDIAKYLPKIIPVGQIAGSTLQEVAGAYAFLTGSLNAETSATGLQNAFKALSDPRFIDGFKKVGVNVYDNAGKFRGIVPIVEDVKKSMSGLTDQQKAMKFDMIGLDMEAKMAFGTMIHDSTALAEAITFAKNSQGQLNLAFKNSQTSTEGWAGAWNKVKFFALEFGDLFLPMIDAAGDMVNSFFKNLQDGYIGVRMVFSGVIAAAKEVWSVISPIGEALMSWSNPAMMAEAFGRAREAFNKMDLKKAFTGAAEDVYYTYKPKGGSDSLNPASTSLAAADAAGFGSVPSGGSTSSIGGATPNKSITITFDNLMKVDAQYINEVGANGEKLSVDEIMNKMNEGFLRLLRNTSAAY